MTDFSKYGTPITNTNQKGSVDFSKYGTPVDNADIVAEPIPEKKNSFLKNIISAPATIIARPIQAVAEGVFGASPEAVDKFSKEKLGGIVAPVPRNVADVKKDVGRGVQTVALGMGPVSGGAAFGAGNSLEQGNDLFSTQTAIQTGIGALGGKALDFIGKPLLNAAGKQIGKITPQVIEDVAAKGSKAIQDFAVRHNILPEQISNVINKGATKAENIANKPFEVTANTAKKVFTKTPQNIINAREKELANIDSNYSAMRKASGFSKDAGVSSRKRVASTDVLVDAVDENGLLRTKQPGGAVDQYKAQTLDNAEGVVRNNLERLGEKVHLDDVEKELIQSINSSGLEGADLRNALNNVKKEIAGYRLKADAEGKIPLVLVHDAKISTTNGINYQTPPEIKTYRKAVARGLKKTVENNSKFNTEEVNAEISKYLEDISFLERLDGKRVKGGKLGKYFSQISGNIIGGLAGGAVGGPAGGAIGTIIGGELGGRIKGSMLQKTLGGRSGFVAPKSEILNEAINLGKSPRLQLPAPKAGQPRVQLSSGESINLPSKTESTVNAEQAYNRKIDFLKKRKAQLDYEKSSGNLNTKYSSTKTPSIKGIPKTIQKPKAKVKLPAKPPKLK